MSETRETTITISDDVALLVREAVAAGGYASASDAIRDALVLRREHEADDLFGLSSEEIDKLIDEADASGPPVHLDIEEIKREGFRRAGVPYPPE